MADIPVLYDQIAQGYKKETDQDFPTNKIRFFMDILWNAVVKKPLEEEQKNTLKQLIDLLNSLDDHKLSPMRELIQAMSGQLTPLLTPYPSLGHTCTVIFTSIIPAYQKYLLSLESMVKDAHPFTQDEVLLYYDMTLVDHLIISHVFEQEHSLNLIEVIETIKTVIIINALTHDYLQDSLARSISMFTFLQRGGLAKEKTHEFYMHLVDTLVQKTKENVTNPDCLSYVEFMSKKLTELTQTGQPTAQMATTTGALPSQQAESPVIASPTTPTVETPVETSVVHTETPVAPNPTPIPQQATQQTPTSAAPVTQPIGTPPQTQHTAAALQSQPISSAPSALSESPSLTTQPIEQQSTATTPSASPMLEPEKPQTVTQTPSSLNTSQDILQSLQQPQA